MSSISILCAWPRRFSCVYLYLRLFSYHCGQMLWQRQHKGAGSGSHFIMAEKAKQTNETYHIYNHEAENNECMHAGTQFLSTLALFRKWITQLNTQLIIQLINYTVKLHNLILNYTIK